MGLSTCFDLALPSDTPGRDAHALLTRLRDEAARLPFRAVSELVQLGPVEESGPSKLRGLAYERLADVVDTYAKLSLERLWRDRLGLDEYVWPKLTSDLPSTAIGFAVAPGRLRTGSLRLGEVRLGRRAVAVVVVVLLQDAVRVGD